VDKINDIRKEIKVNKLAFFDKAYGPIGAIVLANSIISKTGIDAVYVRLRRRLNFDQIKGELKHGDTVIIISDVLTAGDGILNARGIIKENHEDVKVPYAVVFYDRMQGGIWRLWEKGIEVEALFTRVEFAEEGFKDDARPLLITDDIVPLNEEKKRELIKIFGKEAVKIMENTVTLG
jgi:orotate phosphoribosyltransferase